MSENRSISYDDIVNEEKRLQHKLFVLTELTPVNVATKKQEMENLIATDRKVQHDFMTMFKKGARNRKALTMMQEHLSCIEDRIVFKNKTLDIINEYATAFSKDGSADQLINNVKQQLYEINLIRKAFDKTREDCDCYCR